METKSHINNMNNKENENPSTGELEIQLLYSKGEKKQINKKNSQPINVKIDKNDLEIIEYIAAKFGVTRNWLLSEIIEKNINEMFDAFTYKPRYQLALLADELITKKNLPHDFRGATWYWDVVHPDPGVGNPTEKGL